MTIILHTWNPQREKKDFTGEIITQANNRALSTRLLVVLIYLHIIGHAK